MIKTALFVSLAACIAVSGAPRPETSTYVSGNVSALKPNTGGTLVFTDKDSMMFRTGSAEVKVPYASIQSAELGEVQARPHDEPAYKVWTLANRLLRPETQLLTVEFKSGLGESQTMTLQLAKFVAPGVLTTIKEHTGQPVVAAAKTDASPSWLHRSKAEPKAAVAAPATSTDKSAWWGDGYWKTTRNQDSWNTTVASK